MGEAQATENSEILLYPDKGRAALYLSICLAFVFIGMTNVAHHQTGVTAWPSVLFFGAGAAVLSIRFVPTASYLRLRSDGFMFCSLFRASPLMLWRDVSDFRAVRLPPNGRPMVVFDWYAAPDRAMRQINRQFVDATDGLPDCYGLQPEQLAAYMNAWRARAVFNG